MPKRKDIKKILIIGSGPIVIGQACEFDYSGTQACKALMKEGYKVVLVNSNPATIMTDPSFADKVYIEPLTVEFLERIIAKERPDTLLPTMGGQTALNLSVELSDKGILKKYNVKIVGANVDVIKRAEDRDLFKKTINSINLDMPESGYAGSVSNAIKIAKKIGYPVLIRPSFTLGGTGGASCKNESELIKNVTKAINYSPVGKVLIEESLVGWKEFELEMMRDVEDNVVVICTIENVDPMGVHTGDSITVAPSQTLTDQEYQIMRDASLKIMRAIGVDTGGSNIQFAINPENGRMVVIEMNPRVSRSSALASKATGFPIAKIAALLAIGYTLNEIPNDITRKTPSCFEPTIDYTVVKIPRFTFEKFKTSDQQLGSSMKSIGEVMSIGRNFKEALQKALRGLEIGRFGLTADGKGLNKEVERANKEGGPVKDELIKKLTYYLKTPNCERIFSIKHALELGMSIDAISRISSIDRWFINQISEIDDMQKTVSKSGLKDKDVIRQAKGMGFSDYQLGYLTGKTERDIRKYRLKKKITPVYKVVDTCAAEFEAETPYFYSTYGMESETERFDGKSVMIVGGGPNRIGQGIEFDYCCVHCSMALREMGIKSIMVNSNPETVSTDYDISDRLYFEPLTVEDILNIYHNEKVDGMIAQFGGQTPINLAMKLRKYGVKILGTSIKDMERAENRLIFASILRKYRIPIPEFGEANNVKSLLETAETIGYPVIVRPSYVLGGSRMKIVYDKDELSQFILEDPAGADEKIYVDKFLASATEVDVDALSDGRDTFICGIMEHIEEAGIHSGDSACITPPYTLKQDIIDKIIKITKTLGRVFKIVGVFNIQFAVKDNIVYLIELNPRASRTLPYISKARGVQFLNFATNLIMGDKLRNLNMPEPVDKRYAVKEVVFPFERFSDVDSKLGPEMRSTGEVMGTDSDYGMAFYKAQLAVGARLPLKGAVLVSINRYDKEKIFPVVSDLNKMGFIIYATEGTRRFLYENGIKSKLLYKMRKGITPNVTSVIKSGKINLIINTPSRHSKDQKDDGFIMRRLACEMKIPIATTIAGAVFSVAGIKAAIKKSKKIQISAI